MFDTIFNCKCNSGCHQLCTNGKDTYHDWNVRYSNGCSQCDCHRTLGQTILEQNIYYKGYADGRKDELEHNKMRFRSVKETEKFVLKLKEAMKPLEDLLKEIKP